MREWLKSLDFVERKAIGTDLLRAQWRWPVGMPLCRPLGKGLWEIRTPLPTGRTARVLLSAYREQWRASVRRNWSNEQEAYGFEH